MTTSGTKENALRFLEALYDLSGGRPNVSVPLGGSQEEGAATRAGIDPHSTEAEVAARYLLNHDYVKTDGGDPPSYTLNAPGIERVREMRNPGETKSSNEGSGVSDKRQKQLTNALATVIGMGLSQPVNRYIARRIPERKGIKDDALEAALQGLVRTTSIFTATLVMRWFLSSRIR